MPITFAVMPGDNISNLQTAMTAFAAYHNQYPVAPGEFGDCVAKLGHSDDMTQEREHIKNIFVLSCIYMALASHVMIVQCFVWLSCEGGILFKI